MAKYIHRGGTKVFFGSTEYDSGKRCEHCNKKIIGLPWEFRRCDNVLCNNCRLPENHNCIPIKSHKLHINLPDYRFLDKISFPKKHQSHSRIRRKKNYAPYLIILLIIGFIGYFNYEEIQQYIHNFLNGDVDDLVENKEPEIIRKLVGNSLIPIENFECNDFYSRDDGDKLIIKECDSLCLKNEGKYTGISRCTGENKIYCRCAIYTEVLKQEQEFSEVSDTEKQDKVDIGKIKDKIVETTKDIPERKSQCKKTFNKLNDIRISEGRDKLEWDDKLYDLAVFRSKDMWERGYFDHITPEGTCVKDFQSNLGFTNNEIIAENAGGMSYYSKGVVAGDCDETLDSWMSSRGHRYNLLYEEHTKGAIGCYFEICIFLGLNNNPFGLGAGECTSGDEGLAFWNTAPTQPGELDN